MVYRKLAEEVAIRIYRSGLFGVHGRGNFDLTLGEFEELLLISMINADELEVDEKIKVLYDNIRQEVNK